MAINLTKVKNMPQALRFWSMFRGWPGVRAMIFMFLWLKDDLLLHDFGLRSWNHALWNQYNWVTLMADKLGVYS